MWAACPGACGLKGAKPTQHALERHAHRHIVANIVRALPLEGARRAHTVHGRPVQGRGGHQPGQPAQDRCNAGSAIAELLCSHVNAVKGQARA